MNFLDWFESIFQFSRTHDGYLFKAFVANLDQFVDVSFIVIGTDGRTLHFYWIRFVS